MKKSTISITFLMKLIKFFTCWEVEEISKKTGFTKRERGLKANAFLKALTVGLWGLNEVTLDLLAEKCCEAQYGLTLTKQGLFKRLKTGSMFLKEILSLAVAYAAQYSVRTETIEALKQFKNVYLCDSTLLDLPDKLEKIYPGIGSPNPKAGLKIQVIFNLLQRKFKSIELRPVKENDVSYCPNIVKNLSAGDLIIYDLGYYSMATFKEIKRIGAYFLSRFKTNTCVYKEDACKKGRYKKISLNEVLSKSNQIIDEYFYIGAETK